MDKRKAKKGGDQLHAAKKKQGNKPEEVPIAAEVIAPIAASSCGGSGNPHYSRKLRERTKEPQAPVEPIIKPVVAHTTGRGGNPSYKAELSRDKGKKDDQKKSSTKAGSSLKDQANTPEIVEEIVTPVAATSVGGMGNPVYAAKLNKEASQKKKSPEIVEEIIKPVSATSCGGRGKPRKK